MLGTLFLGLRSSGAVVPQLLFCWLSFDLFKS